MRKRTGASIVSIIEPDRVKRINPGSDTVLNEGATHPRGRPADHRTAETPVGPWKGGIAYG